MKRIGLFIIAVFPVLCATAQEPAVRDGLVAHWDAAAQPAARQTAAMPPIGNRQPVDVWLDGSPAGREATQSVAERRPVFMTDGTAAFVRFDGKDDFLGAGGARQLVPATTVFVVAAPRRNPGMFSGMVAFAETGRNDYTSGLNLDFGPIATQDLSVVNVEGAGAGGARDLLVPSLLGAAERPFGGFHVFTVRSRIGTGGIEFFLDGLKGGERARLESNVGLDRITVGSRLYSNDPAQPPFGQGSFDGDIATVLVYDRALSEPERAAVEQSLFARIAPLNALASGKNGHSLATLNDPPVVQMLVPGFRVEELPVKLTNVTNVRYRHDGKLVALGYDGRLHLLEDTDGDGLEDKAEVFWDKAPLRAPIGLELLPRADARGEGAFVSSKAKVSLILDRDRDGRADEEIIAATGWNETFHGVDTLGLAIDPKDGAIYFSIGCANFTDGYLRDASGRATYRLDNPRGTIQRLSPDFKTRETVCTGVRFACALAFNHLGDLFATDQEGATWLPNGNPFDELLHIVPGRHYGFPPRHPRHLPDVIDEPAVMEYGPQHQSTVGMVFNNGINGGPSFGPAFWRGDALICGESRGKIYRTRLVKTAQGYIAQNHLIACLGLLTVDACVSPQGDLLIACHSGPPDWGTGPVGEGRIFKVRHVGKELPQPVHAWAAARDEFRIAFDRELDPNDWAGAKEKVRIEAGGHVSAGDRYEIIRPGYQAVRDQMAAPRRWVDLHSLSLSADQRTLVLRVPRQTEEVTYAVTLPVPAKWKASGGLAQRPELDLAISLHGVEGRLDGIQTILPHPSLTVSEALTGGSAEHAAFFAARAKQPSGGTIAGKIDVSNLFVPATQPGTALDWDIARDAFASRTMDVKEESNGVLGNFGLGRDEGPWRKFAFPQYLTRGSKSLVLALDDKVRPVPLDRLLVPWAAPRSEKPAAASERLARSDVKGRWLHGRRLYFGEAACFTCHTIRGEGMSLGPDLTNLVFRDRESVLQDIVQPSATLNPDHPGSTVTFTDGTSLTGLLQKLDEAKAVVRLAGGAVVERPRPEVARIEPLKTSLMTEGYRDRLTPAAMEDLLTFLLTSPLEPAPITRVDPPAPPARTRTEIAAYAMPLSPAATMPPLRVLLSGGVKDHGIDEHDYPLWLDRWSRLLALADGVTVTTCNGFPSQALLDAADVTVFYSNNAGWNLGAAALLDRYQQRGGGAVYLHWGIEGHKDAAALAERAGLAFSFSAFRHGEMDLVFTDRTHPITRGFDRLRFVDESYWKLHGDRARLALLATSTEDQQPQPQLWTLERGQARVFGCIPGHYTWTFDDPLYRLLVLRGIAWAAKQDDVNRFAELMTVGARIAP